MFAKISLTHNTHFSWLWWWVSYGCWLGEHGEMWWCKHGDCGGRSQEWTIVSHKATTRRHHSNRHEISGGQQSIRWGSWYSSSAITHILSNPVSGDTHSIRHKEVVVAAVASDGVGGCHSIRRSWRGQIELVVAAIASHEVTIASHEASIASDGGCHSNRWSWWLPPWHHLRPT